MNIFTAQHSFRSHFSSFPKISTGRLEIAVMSTGGSRMWRNSHVSRRLDDSWDNGGVVL